MGSAVSTIAGEDVYVVDSSTPEFAGMSNQYAVALVDGLQNVLQFVSFHGYSVTATEGPANTLTSTEIGTVNTGETLQSNDGGSTYFAQSVPNKGTIPCYAPGTLIETPNGPRPVEGLRVGDLVLTRDRGPRAVRWVRNGEMPLDPAHTAARPVLIRKDALGRDLPNRDMIVSPQHRILVGGAGQLQQFFAGEAFAPAKALVGLARICPLSARHKIMWHHFACDRHKIVTANGCQSESLLLGPMAMQSLPDSQRRILHAMFGTPHDPSTQGRGPCAAFNGTSARPNLKVNEVRRTLFRGSKAEKGSLPGAAPVATTERTESALIRGA